MPSELRLHLDESRRQIDLESGRVVALQAGQVSKAAILLAYFDDWIDEFVVAVCAGPPEERVDDAVVRSYAVMDAAGRVDNRTLAEMDALHPIVELFASTELDIPGHVLQSWVRAHDVLTAHFAIGTDDLLAARTKAAAIFATWMVTLLTYRDSRAGEGPLARPLHEIAIAAIRRFDAGVDAS